MNMRESLDAILDSEKAFGSAFYRTFFGRCPDARQYFVDVDMHRQSLVLTMALTLIQQYHERGYAAVEKYLHHLGMKHGDRRVPRELYSDWRDAMLETLASFLGTGWNDGLAAEWREAIDSVSNVMFVGYEERQGM